MTDRPEQARQLVLGEILARWARKQPDKEALVFKDRRFTYREFDERVNRLANGLSSLGIGKGDKVGVIFMNCNEIAECFFAVARLGAVTVPSNFRFTAREHVYQMDQSDSKVLVFGEMFQDVVQSMRADLPRIEHYICPARKGVPGTIDYEGLLRNNSPEAPDVYVEDDDPAFIMYTSGTTGRPKGAVLTHKNLVMVGVILSFYREPRSENQLLAFPLFHQAASAIFMAGIYSGITNIILEMPTPENIMAAILEERIQDVALVPALWNWFLNHPKLDEYDLSCLRIGKTGAAPMPVELKDQIRKRFPNLRLTEAFGMTETTACGTIALHEDFLAKHGTVGRPMVHLDVRVVDENDRDVSVGEVGEIVYRGPTVMKEYYKNPEATAEAFKGGWFHSGDLVRQDEEGFIYVVDRKKDVIISGGENIYPVELEEVLYAHPKILEAAVVGVPDPEWGESVKAYVVLNQGENLNEEEVIAYCKANMASYKKPKSVEFIDLLPRTTTGKVLKYELRERAKQGASAGEQ